MKENNQDKTVIENNLECYQDYYQKPWWWFRFRYDTQVKKKSVLYLLKKIHEPVSHKKVLEIGFGSGAVLFSFDDSCEIHGVEVSESAVRQANLKAQNKGYRNYSFHLAQDSTLPFADATFDVVIASHVLEHVNDDIYTLLEMRRVLRNDGSVIIIVPINENYDDPNHQRHYTSETLQTVMMKSHFSVYYSEENEYLFHVVEKFYFEKYNTKWKILGPIITLAFNIPTSLIPYAGIRVLESIMRVVGFKPRQVGIVARK